MTNNRVRTVFYLGILMALDSFFGYADDEERANALLRLAPYLKEKELNELEDNIMEIDNLVYLTMNMKIDLLKEFSTQRLGICFKYCTQDFLKEFLNGFSKTVKQEILHFMQQKYRIGDVTKNIQELCHYIKVNEGAGRINLSKSKSEEYV